MRLFLIFCPIVICGAADLSADDNSVVFARDIQPLLAKHCFECHGPDKAESGLRLDTSDGATAKLESELPAIVPGRPDQSELLRRVTSNDDDRMPPEGPRLSDSETERLRRWIKDGAVFEEHWSYRPVQAPKLPKVSHEEWISNDIDRYILARLEAVGMEPSAEAHRATLIKRVYYDLIGLPPSPEEVDRFLGDSTPDAYERLVDQLLASRHFGERWGRHWLDKARYADSDGYEKDRPRPNAWRYRDWVINAINRDLPFDQFTIEQLAGDLLPDATASQRLATAFHRQTLTNTEGGTDKEQFRVEATFDRTETTSAVWMGLTMTCARCHTHKYDQITQREYYQLFAFFNDSNEGNTEVVTSATAEAEFEQRQEKHQQKVVALKESLQSELTKIRPQISEWEVRTKAQLKTVSQVRFSPSKPISTQTSGKSKLSAADDGSVLASGAVLDKDKYTLVFAAPQEPLTGFKVELLTDGSLPAKGPGRAKNGNFVLTHIRAYVSHTEDFKEHTAVELSVAEADFAQEKFPAANALVSDAKSGWAISPQIGRPHEITVYAAAPVDPAEFKYVQLVLDQQYGGQHTLGRFRVSLMSGFDASRALPKAVVDALGTAAEERTAAQQQAIDHYVSANRPETRELVRKLTALKSAAPKRPTMSVRIIQPATRTTKVLHRGDFLQPADEVTAAALNVVGRTHTLASRHSDKTADRLDLARWLTDPGHPLSARVTVNHVWAHLVGRGIVPTLNDFGVRGELPTHPELLDYLAWTFPREWKWSRKQLIREIVMSSTYRQASIHRADLREADPTNRLFARQNRVRVEAEVVRDLYLSVSGLLSTKLGGPSVFPPLPAGVAELSYANNFKWKTSEGEDRYRRGMYTFFKRTSPHPTLISFDCPDSNTTRLARATSNTPLQALATLNNDVFAETAQAMARRVLETEQDDPSRLQLALRLCTFRVPSAEQLQRFEELLTAGRDYYSSHPDDAKLATGRHAAKDVSREENAAWVATVRMILNLDEFIVRD